MLAFEIFLWQVSLVHLWSSYLGLNRMSGLFFDTTVTGLQVRHLEIRDSVTFR